VSGRMTIKSNPSIAEALSYAVNPAPAVNRPALKVPQPTSIYASIAPNHLLNDLAV